MPGSGCRVAGTIIRDSLCSVLFACMDDMQEFKIYDQSWANVNNTTKASSKISLN